jgi:FAD/FMN-containing dehydrogenase
MFLTKEVVRLAMPGLAEGVACERCPRLGRLFEQSSGSETRGPDVTETGAIHTSAGELPKSRVTELAATLRGSLIRPGDRAYEGACKLWNGMIQRRPALVARCASTPDVVAAVRFARDHRLPVAVRGGGHGVAGHALCDGGLVIDLSEMRAVEVDPDDRTARAQGGCTLADLDRETQRHGLATPLGVVTETGIAGLTLTGGMGWLRRKHGLSCDNLVAAEVVTADGKVLTATDERHPDLLWGLRGGGGNFGVATALEYRLHPVGPDVFVCFAVYPADRAVEVLQACDEYLKREPDDLAPLGVLGTVPSADDFPAESHGEPFVALLAVHPGDPSDGERAVRPLRELGGEIADLSGSMPYTQAQALLDEDYPDGRRYYWKSLNTSELGEEAIGRLARHAAAAPSPLSTIDVWFQGGAMGRPAEGDTAFANRAAPYLLGIEANWEDEARSAENVAWARGLIADMREFSDGGLYLNFPGMLEEQGEVVKAGYGGNYERLADVKRTYDPTNFFRLNANVEPAS